MNQLPPRASLALGLSTLVTGLAAPAAAQVQFVDVTAQAGVTYTHGAALGQINAEPPHMSGGGAACDVDGDGWVDVFVTRLDQHDILFRNLGTDPSGAHLGFVDWTATAFPAQRPGTRSNGVAFGDIDNDGDPDLYLTSLYTTRYQLWTNDGSGRFIEQADPLGAALETNWFHLGTSPSFGDYDRDGWLDLYVAEWGLTPHPGVDSHARLLRNTGGQFVDVTDAAGVAQNMVTGIGVGWNPLGVFVFTPKFSDLDGDGWPDLAMAGDFGTSRLFWNNGNGTFTDGTAAAGVGSDENGMGATIADFNGDGRLDWFVTSIYDPLSSCTTGGTCNWGDSGNRLYYNVGGRQFQDRTDAAGVRQGGWGWGAVSVDHDNDGDTDLTMTNGVIFNGSIFDDPFNADPMRFWRNDGASFTEISASCGITDDRSGKGLFRLDYDRDGDQDLMVINTGSSPVLYRNDGGNTNDWLQLTLEGTNSTRDAAGSKVYVTVTSGGATRFQESSRSSNFLSQDEPVLQFGLGVNSASAVHEVRIEWLSGQITVLNDIARNQRLHVVEP